MFNRKHIKSGRMEGIIINKYKPSRNDRKYMKESTTYGKRLEENTNRLQDVVEKAIEKSLEYISDKVNFTQLTFIIEPGSRYTIAYVDPSEIKKGKRILHISMKPFLDNQSRSQRKEGIDDKKLYDELLESISGTIVHEMAHIIHNDETRIFTKMEHRRKSLEKKLKSHVSKTDDRLHIRMSLSDIISNIHQEGVAEYSRYDYHGKLSPSSHTFNKLYENAKNSSLALMKDFEAAFSEQHGKTRDHTLRSKMSFVKSSIDLSYSIGLHMVYTLIVKGEETIESVRKMSPFEFIREYEKVMKHLHLTPIVSKTHNGIINYKEMLHIWNDSLD